MGLESARRRLLHLGTDRLDVCQAHDVRGARFLVNEASQPRADGGVDDLVQARADLGAVAVPDRLYQQVA